MREGDEQSVEIRLPPPFYRPQLASLVKLPPEGDGWLHELKYDGYRIGCRVFGDEVALVTRNGNDWTARLPELAEAVRGLATRDLLLDGELAVLLPDGRTSFQALQGVLSSPPPRPLVYFAFDLLWLDGTDVARAPLDERKTLLANLVEELPRASLVRLSKQWIGNGPLVFQEVCRLGFEGIVSKRRQLGYEPGRHGGWLKAKCLRRQELVIGGFTEPEGTREGIGALLVGTCEQGRFVFAGKVGTGFTQASARALRGRLERIRVARCPFEKPPEGWLGRNARWVSPELVAEVAFAEWTRDGRLRHPSFQGLREDKRPDQVVLEKPSAGPRREREEPKPRVAGLSISHPERLVFPDAGLTKLELVRYYEAVAEHILPHLDGRPLTLLHCAEGIGGPCRFLKHSKAWAPAVVRRVSVPEKTKVGEYLVVDSVEALVALAQMNVIELHTWNSRVGHLEEPDRVVIDVDPGPQVPWARVVEAARLVRTAFEALGLECFLKTTGGTGLHVVAPLLPERDWRECLAFSRGLARAIVAQEPEHFTVALPKVGRERKILLDYLRNNRTNTSVSAFSVRARASAPVSVPIAWEELDSGVRADSFTVASVPERLRTLEADPWRRYGSLRQRIAPSAYAAVTASSARR